MCLKLLFGIRAPDKLLIISDIKKIAHQPNYVFVVTLCMHSVDILLTYLRHISGSLALEWLTGQRFQPLDFISPDCI